MVVTLAKEVFVECAHRNPAGGPVCARLHGHSYRLEILAQGEVCSPEGWLVDFADIKAAFEPIRVMLDHNYLNGLPGLESPCLNRLRAWIEEQIPPDTPWFHGVRVAIVGDCAFRPVKLPPAPEEGLPERLRFTFEAAQSLPQLPSGHPCRRLHGHSYRIELAAKDLDRLAGPLKAAYDAIDHRNLNEVPGLETATSEVICRWLWERLEPHVNGLRAVVVQETGTARCLYTGE